MFWCELDQIIGKFLQFESYGLNFPTIMRTIWKDQIFWCGLDQFERYGLNQGVGKWGLNKIVEKFLRFEKTKYFDILQFWTAL